MSINEYVTHLNLLISLVGFEEVDKLKKCIEQHIRLKCTEICACDCKCRQCAL